MKKIVSIIAMACATLWTTQVGATSISETAYETLGYCNSTDQEEHELDFSERIVTTSERMIKNGDLAGGVDYFINNITKREYKDDIILYVLAKTAEEFKAKIMAYTYQQAAKYNMYNAGALLAEAAENTNRTNQLNVIMCTYALLSADKGNEEAQMMVARLKAAAGLNNPYGGFQYSNPGQNNSNNESRKQQLLNNIATYEKRIREAEQWTNTGSVTDYGYISIISDYRRMIEDAKRELRSMGYNIY